MLLGVVAACACAFACCVVPVLCPFCVRSGIGRNRAILLSPCWFSTYSRYTIQQSIHPILSTPINFMEPRGVPSSNTMCGWLVGWLIDGLSSSRPFVLWHAGCSSMAKEGYIAVVMMCVVIHCATRLRLKFLEYVLIRFAPQKKLVIARSHTGSGGKGLLLVPYRCFFSPPPEKLGKQEAGLGGRRSWCGWVGPQDVIQFRAGDK